MVIIFRYYSVFINDKRELISCFFFSAFELSVTSLVLVLVLLLGLAIKTLCRRWAGSRRRRRGNTVPKEHVSNNLFYIHILNTFNYTICDMLFKDCISNLPLNEIYYQCMLYYAFVLN